MPIDKPEITERLAWEGLVSGWTALAIWLALAAVTAWFLWRERNAVGRGWAVAFWVMRMVAFGCVLWMLAGPTQQRIERTSTSQSVSIFADDSESMDIVDPPEPTETLRWTLAEKDNGAKEPVVLADRLTRCAGRCTCELQRAFAGGQRTSANERTDCVAIESSDSGNSIEVARRCTRFVAVRQRCVDHRTSQSNQQSVGWTD